MSRVSQSGLDPGRSEASWKLEALPHAPLAVWERVCVTAAALTDVIGV